MYISSPPPLPLDALPCNQLGETHAIGGGVGGEGTDDMGAIEVSSNAYPGRC